jgi:peptidoglycan hydrolase CwlO-like protein
MADEDNRDALILEKDSLINELANGLEDAEKDIRSLMSQLAALLKSAEKAPAGAAGGGGGSPAPA